MFVSFRDMSHYPSSCSSAEVMEEDWILEEFGGSEVKREKEMSEGSKRH
jgi:hypothetical protein